MEMVSYTHRRVEREAAAPRLYTAMRPALGITFAVAWILAVAAFAAGQSPTRVSHPPTYEEARELLKAICPNGVRADHLGPITYQACSPCPRFTTRGASARLWKGYFDLHTVVYGSFSAPGAQEAVGDFLGCEDHATTADFQGSVLYRKTAGRWQMLDYARTETSQCKVARLPSGRDILVCKGFMGHADEAEEWIFSFEFQGSAGWREIDLFAVTSTWGACGPTAIVGSIPRFELRDLNHDGTPNLSITTKVIREEHRGKMGVCAGDFAPPAAKTYRIDFLLEQGTFVVAPWSAEVKEILEQEFRVARGERK